MRRRAIIAVQIWICRAFSLVPTKVLAFRFCFRKRKNFSRCPPIPANGRNGGGSQRHVVGEKDKVFAFVRISDRDLPEDETLKILPVLPGDKVNLLIDPDVANLRQTWHSPDFVGGILLHPGDEEDALLRPVGKEAVVVVSPVYDDDGVVSVI